MTAKLASSPPVILPTPDIGHWQNVFDPPYQGFATAASPGAKLHITDAFASGDTAWTQAAKATRSEIFSLVAANRVRIVYIAREASVARKTHASMQDLIARAKLSKPPHLTISDRPSETRLVSECYEGVVRTVDIMAESVGYQHVAIYADEIDEGVLKVMEADADALRRLSKRQVELEGYDKQKQAKLSRTLTFSTDRPGIDVTRVGTITPLGKSNSLVFAADVIANSLLHHLHGLPADASLNNMTSVAGWDLESCVFAPPDDEHDVYSKF